MCAWGGGTGLGAGVPLWASSTQRAGLQRWRCAALSSMQRLHLPCAEVPAGSEVRAPVYGPTLVLGPLGLSSLTPVLAPSLAFQDFQGGPCEPGQPCRQPWAWPGHVYLSPRSHCVHVREGCWQQAFLLHSWRPKYQTVGWVSPLGARPSRLPSLMGSAPASTYPFSPYICYGTQDLADYPACFRLGTLDHICEDPHFKKRSRPEVKVGDSLVGGAAPLWVLCSPPGWGWAGLDRACVFLLEQPFPPHLKACVLLGVMRRALGLWGAAEGSWHLPPPPWTPLLRQRTLLGSDLCQAAAEVPLQGAGLCR